jgi:DUF4097 and DUF4098 domain-containing protein YvlB
LTLLCICLALPGLAVAACSDDPTGPGVPGGDTEWQGDLAAGDIIEIKGINGNIFATAVAGEGARVIADIIGNGDDPSLVTIEVVEHAGGVTVCAIYPDVPGNSPNDCEPGDGGSIAGNIDVIVNFTIEVPAGVLFDGTTVNGNISATGLTADASAITVNGGISISSDGLVEAITVNGNIAAQTGVITPARPLSFLTVNGNVALVLPASVNASILATTANGIMTSDFPLTEVATGRWEGTLGEGGLLLTMATVNGNLQMLEAP